MAGFFDRIREKWAKEDTWPPKDVRDHWFRIAGHERLYRNTRDEMIRHNPDVMVDDHKTEIFTPVAWPRELCRFSSALLFSETPKVTRKGSEEDLARLIETNDFGAFAVRGGVQAAVAGRVAVRVIKDPAISADTPLLALVEENKVIWDIRHGRFYAGGMVVIERKHVEKDENVVYRLMEEHTTGRITRHLYRGRNHELGKPVALSTVREFEGLAQTETTGLDRPTLVPWENVPGAESDLFGLEPLFKVINEAETLMRDRGQKAIPRVFVTRSLADDTGRIQIDGYIFTGGSRLRTPLGKTPATTIHTVQTQLYSTEHVAWIDHVTQLLVTCAGYAPETWGIQGHTANVQRAVSGYALKLSQLRTLLTRAAKEHMALQALGWAVATALCWEHGQTAVRDFLPTIELGDGLPNDPLDGAQEVLYLSQANAASRQTLVKTVHPTWSAEEVADEVALIEEAGALAAGMAQGVGGLPSQVRDLLRRPASLTEAGGGTDPTSGVE